MINPKLFVIYIGGRHQKSFIELHDIRFVLASHIEETYTSLRESWWGLPESLHLDAWGILENVENYAISFSLEAQSAQDNRLFFVNLGGYDSQQFTELHQNIFVIAKDEAEAKSKALLQVSSWEVPHRDYLQNIETLIDVGAKLAGEQPLHLHLKKIDSTNPFTFTCQYTPIGTKKIAPNITRQRFLIEGFFDKNINAEIVRHYLFDVAKHLNLRTYGEPTIHSPEGLGKNENQGFDAFIPLIDSGISLYIWTNEGFLSIVFYTCKAFQEDKALTFTQNYFNMKNNFETLSF
jgi:hypothetical protein